MGAGAQPALTAPGNHPPQAAVVLLLLILPACSLFHSTERTRFRAKSDRERFNEAYRLTIRGHYETAIRQLRPIAESPDPRNAFRDDAAFWLAYCHKENGDRYRAEHWFRRLLQNHPASPYAPAARERLELLTMPAP